MKGTLTPVLVIFLGLALMLTATMGASAENTHAKVLVLYRFTGGNDGGNPYGPLIADQSGNLYGATFSGGGSNLGVVFEISADGKGGWTETVLHSFGGADGAYPNSGLTADSQGDLYGTTFSGTGDAEGGAAFELSSNGNGGWTYSLLNGFGNANSSGGSNPNGSVALDSDGNLYGTTQLGGSGICTNFPAPCGVVFELSPAKKQRASWTESVLYSFRGPPDGSFPYASPVFDTAGNLYATTSEGGSGKCNDGEGNVIGCGTVFELSPTQGGWSEALLYQFRKSEQSAPGSVLVFGSDGTLFGTAGYDVFRLKQSAGSSWKKETIYEFAEGIAGTIPSGGVAFDRHNNLYGTTASSGLDGYSTVFELSPARSGQRTQQTLARFGKGLDSNQPRGGILVGGDGTLYGAVSGTAGRGYIFALAR